MPVVSTALPVSTTSAYLRVCLNTGSADFICGPQVAYVLESVLGSLDGDVSIWPYGMLMSREADCEVQYHRLHLSGWHASDHSQYLFTTYRGKQSEPRGVVSREEMVTRVNRARGSVYGLCDGSVVSVFNGLIAARWTPVRDVTL